MINLRMKITPQIMLGGFALLMGKGSPFPTRLVMILSNVVWLKVQPTTSESLRVMLPKWRYKLLVTYLKVEGCVSMETTTHKIVHSCQVLVEKVTP